MASAGTTNPAALEVENMRSHYDFANAARGKYVGRTDQQSTPTRLRSRWHHPSIKLLAGERDPVEVVVESARELVLQAVDAGVLTVPVDPFKLAELRAISVIPKADVVDAQTVPGEAGKPVIHYNPNRSKARIRFSICHELGHTLFRDCTEQVRHRLFHDRTSAVDYELEALCNLAAAELLLPLGSVQEDMARLDFSVETALKLRNKYEASTEAVLLRLAGLSAMPCAVFAAAPEEPNGPADRRYRLEYIKNAITWAPGLHRGDLLPANTVARECTGIGFTASGNEEWVQGSGRIRIEAVGIPPYPNRDPNRVLPRVTGLARPLKGEPREDSWIRFVRGNALEPRGVGTRIIAHIVNDKTPNWGAGFGRALQQKWPDAQHHFAQVFAEMPAPKLGRTCISRVASDVYVFQMVSQHGYGPSPTTRLRYEALRACLEQLRSSALQLNASVHMPRIGTGQAGGSWGLIANLIIEELCARGIAVTVYDLPDASAPSRGQTGLFDSAIR